jgi:elongation factor G
LVGDSGTGKTSLAEAMLYNAGVITRLGRVEEGNTVMDVTKEEVERKMSIYLSLGHYEWKKSKNNILDTPGYSDFKGELINALRGVETALITVSATANIEVITEESLQYANKVKDCKAFVINQIDRENAQFYEVIEKLEKLGNELLVPIIIPIGTGEHLTGVIDVVTKTAYDRDGKQIDLPADMQDTVEKYYDKIIEAAAESDDSLMEKYFDQGSLSTQEIHDGLKKSIINGDVAPVFACSATQNIGIKELMDVINDFFPSPEDIESIPVKRNNENELLNLRQYDKRLGYVIKSISEPNLGDIAYVRLYSSSLKTGDEIEIAEQRARDKIGQIFSICGKKREPVDEITAGDIGGLVKLKNAKTAASINEKDENIIIKPVEYPEPVYWRAIKPRSQEDEDKIANALSKIAEEDVTIHVTTNPETNENVIAGQGDIQIGLLQKQLKERYNVDVDLKEPKIPYKETITGTADVSYRHKKQTGGHGQYGEVYIKISPLEAGAGFEFVNSIVGGAIPSKFIPAVEKGLGETMKEGVWANYPVVDIRVELYDGTFHEVDSSEMSFKIAARNALKNGFIKANPVLLEPIHKVRIVVPSEYMGDVMSDISSRRGKILGMTQEDGKQVINAEMPLSSLYNYYTTLKALTQGRGYFTQDFAYYQRMPKELAGKIIEESKQEK